MPMPHHIHPSQHEDVRIYIEKCHLRLRKLSEVFERKGTMGKELVAEICETIRQLEQLIDNCFFDIKPTLLPISNSAMAVAVVIFSKAILLEDTQFERIIYNSLRQMANIELSRDGKKKLCEQVLRIGNKRVRMLRMDGGDPLEEVKKEFEMLNTIVQEDTEPCFKVINPKELMEMLEMMKKEDFDMTLNDFEVVGEMEAVVVEDEFVLV